MDSRPAPRRRERGRRGRGDAQRLTVRGVTAPQLHAEAAIMHLGRWQRPLLVPLDVGAAAGPDDGRTVEDLAAPHGETERVGGGVEADAEGGAPVGGRAIVSMTIVEADNSRSYNGALHLAGR